MRRLVVVALVPLFLAGAAVTGLPAVGRTGQAFAQEGGGRRRPALEQARLTYVSPAVRTQTRRGEWLEALPDQSVENNTRIATSKHGGAELSVGSEIHVILDPDTTVVVRRLRRGGRGVGELELVSGGLLAEVSDHKGVGPLRVRTESGELKLRGTTVRLQAEPGPGSRLRIAVYQGRMAVRTGRLETPLAAGQGALIAPGDRVAIPLELPGMPGWPDGAAATQDEPLHGLLALSPHPLGADARRVELDLDFPPVPGATGYLVEVGHDPRFHDRRQVVEVAAPPFRAKLPVGLHYVRLTAIGKNRITGPSTPARAVYVLPVFSNGELQTVAGKLRLQRLRTLRLRANGAGLPLRLSLAGGQSQDCQGECMMLLGIGEHRVVFTLNDARAELVATVPPPPPPPPPPAPPPPVEDRVEPVEIAAPLFAAGFPGRALDPRSRVYGLFGIGSSAPDRALNVVRLDVGGEIMLIRRRLSIDLNIPLIYFSSFATATGEPRSGLALGDIAIGGRVVAVNALNGRLRFGPLLRIQAPTGSYERGPSPTHPVVIDPGVGLAASLGRVGLLTTQALPISVNVTPANLRWTMSYVAEVRVSRLFLVGEVDAALGLYGGVPSGAAAGGGLRLHLGQHEAWRILLGARGGFGDGGQALFGRYTAQAGFEWVY